LTDDEYLALFRAASPKAQRQAIMIGLALLDFIQRKKAAKRQRQQTPATADSVETQAVKPTPAPLVVIPTPVEPVEERPLDTLEILDTDDDATKMRKLLARQAKERARCNNNAVQNDEDILRGKIKPDDGFLGDFAK